MGVYHTVKICFPGKMWVSLGENWRSAATRFSRIGEKMSVLHQNSIAKKDKKKYPRKLILGYIGKLEKCTIFQ